ncbi:hypothetical protein ACK8HX_02180 [Oryzobacter sp. R7]|uniref:hypothetical protein n=1 Tax=Oryzobacter faecalis TaxID=3388656 RepID=UPI00398CE859
MNPVRRHHRQVPIPDPAALPALTPPPPATSGPPPENPPADEFTGLFQYGVLVGLQRKHIYAGTVPPQVVARRRRRNKQARLSRRANRR